MSEISGYVLVYSKNKSTFEDMSKEFMKGTELTIDEENFSITEASSEDILDLYIYTSEYSDTENICKYINQKYKPDILICSFDNEAFMKKKKCKPATAFSKLSAIKPSIGFYLNIQYGKYKEAFNLLRKGDVELNDSFAGTPNYERCFFGDYAPLMEFAVDRGFHDLICRHDKNSPYCDGDGEHILHRLINCGDINLLKKALQLGANPNGLDLEEHTLLHTLPCYSISNENTLDYEQLINELKLYGADFNAKDWEGVTPIFYLAQQIDLHSDACEQKVAEIVELYIRNGALIDGYDKTGAGLLMYFKGLSLVDKLLRQENSDLKCYSEDFDINEFIMEQGYLHSSNLPDSYDEYFMTCVKWGFIDYMFEKECVNILLSLSARQLKNILDSAVLSTNIYNVLQGFLKNNLPVLIEYDSYTSLDSFENYDGEDVFIEDCNSIDVAEHYNNQDVLNFYKELEGKAYNKIVIAKQRIGSDNDYKIETA